MVESHPIHNTAKDIPFDSIVCLGQVDLDCHKTSSAFFLFHVPPDFVVYNDIVSYGPIRYKGCVTRMDDVFQMVSESGDKNFHNDLQHYIASAPLVLDTSAMKV